MSEVLSARELADYLGVSYRTVLNLAKDGKLPGLRLGTTWRFRRKVIDRLLAGGGARALLSQGGKSQ
jgi:excisionase family DNA binding protein